MSPATDADPSRAQQAAPDPVVQLGFLSGQLGHALRRAQATMLVDLQPKLAAEGFRPIQFVVLEVLGHNPGLRQARVSAALGMKHTNLVPLLDELEQRGLMQRRKVMADRRASALFLTEAGSQATERLRRIVAEHEARFAARLGPHGRHELLGLLQRLTDPGFDPGR
jgi:DNA-binding MarR family transcriptional regulator